MKIKYNKNYVLRKLDGSNSSVYFNNSDVGHSYTYNELKELLNTYKKVYDFYIGDSGFIVILRDEDKINKLITS